jgi:hypothetical protein
MSEIYVRYGSKADIEECPADVLFTPKADLLATA